MATSGNEVWSPSESACQGLGEEMKAFGPSWQKEHQTDLALPLTSDLTFGMLLTSLRLGGDKINQLYLD